MQFPRMAWNPAVMEEIVLRSPLSAMNQKVREKRSRKKKAQTAPARRSTTARAKIP